MRSGSDLDGPAEVRLGPAQPEHPSNRHANTQPGEETEEVNDGKDVLGQRIEHGQATLVGEEKRDRKRNEGKKANERETEREEAKQGDKMRQC